MRGLTARHFSLAVKGGRCEACAGTGLRRVDLDLLPDVFLVCEVCDGRRFSADVREVRYRGSSPDGILELVDLQGQYPGAVKGLRVEEPTLDIVYDALLETR